MKLLRIRLQDYRNIAGAALDLPCDRCFLVGANGQGKTNLLEAVGYVSALRAFRPGNNRVLIREGASEAAMAYAIEHERMGPSDVIVRVRPDGKEASFDGTPVRRLADIIGRFPTVLFSTEDVEVIRGPPSRRRRWLDLHLASLDPGYLETLQHYHRVLEQRNRLLKSPSGEAGGQHEAFERLLAPAACGLVTRRRAAVDALAALVAEFHGRISGGLERVSVAYRPEAATEDAPAFLAALQRHRPRDLQMRSTQHGPHRDDLAFSIGGREAALFASEGQQRAFALALRFAQLRDARTRTGIAPVVLADDVLGELDQDRRARFWASLDPDLQLLATGTTLPAGVDHRWMILRVQAGTFSAEPVDGARAGEIPPPEP